MEPDSPTPLGTSEESVPDETVKKSKPNETKTDLLIDDQKKTLPTFRGVMRNRKNTKTGPVGMEEDEEIVSNEPFFP